MKKLYNKFFYISKNGKIRDEVMLVRLVMTVIIVVMCLVAMSFSSYAFFTYSLSSGSNTITAASFDIEVTIKDSAGKISESNILDAGTYNITIKKNGTASTGYAKILITGATIKEKQYITNQLGPIPDNSETLSFDIISNEEITLTFIANWGTSTLYDANKNGDKDESFIINGKTINLSANETESSDTIEDTTSKPSSTPAEENTTTPPTETTKPAETTKPNGTVNNETTTATPESTTLPSPETTSQDIPETTEESTTAQPDETMEPTAILPTETAAPEDIELDKVEKTQPSDEITDAADSDK